MTLGWKQIFGEQNTDTRSIKTVYRGDRGENNTHPLCVLPVNIKQQKIGHLSILCGMIYFFFVSS